VLVRLHGYYHQYGLEDARKLTTSYQKLVKRGIVAINKEAGTSDSTAVGTPWWLHFHRTLTHIVKRLSEMPLCFRRCRSARDGAQLRRRE
jgi:hypothetical protein